MFVKFRRVKKACVEDGGEREGALDYVLGLRLEFRCKTRVHTRVLVPEASLCDKFLRVIVCADLKVKLIE